MFCYLIFSHGSAVQLLRLAKTIRRLSPASFILVHHDKSAPPLDETWFEGIGNVHFVPKPKAVRWGHMSFVDAFVHSSLYALKHLKAEWLITISGADYPIQALAEFEDHLCSSEFDASFRYFNAFDENSSGWPRDEGAKRYLYQYYETPGFPYFYKLPASTKNLISRITITINKTNSWIRWRHRYRNLPSAIGFRSLSNPFTDKFCCFGGWDWFNLNAKSVAEIHRFIEINPRIIKYYARTLLPSESLVHSILVNSPGIRVQNEAFRYVKWTGDFSVSPGIIDSTDFDRLIQSGCPFARKFDLNVQASIFDQIDAWTLKASELAD